MEIGAEVGTETVEGAVDISKKPGEEGAGQCRDGRVGRAG